MTSSPVRALWEKAAFVGLTAAALACGSVAPSRVAVAPQPMPAGGEWQGVYQGPYHIYLRIERTGEQARGSWRAMGGRSGELQGKVNGNVLEFHFTEQDMQTKNAWSGRGYFVYHQGDETALPEIRGEWGLGTSAPDSSWYAVKRPEVPLAAAESRLSDTSSSAGSNGDESADTCIGAACVGDDRGGGDEP